MNIALTLKNAIMFNIYNTEYDSLYIFFTEMFSYFIALQEQPDLNLHVIDQSKPTATETDRKLTGLKSKAPFLNWSKPTLT